MYVEVTKEEIKRQGKKKPKSKRMQQTIVQRGKTIKIISVVGSAQSTDHIWLVLCKCKNFA